MSNFAADMERRIKFIYGLTICAIVAYSIVQGYWLYSRYRLSLEEYKSELYHMIIACAEEEMAIRKTLPHPPRFYGNRFKKTYDIKGTTSDCRTRNHSAICMGERQLCQLPRP